MTNPNSYIESEPYMVRDKSAAGRPVKLMWLKPNDFPLPEGHVLVGEAVPEAAIPPELELKEAA